MNTTTVLSAASLQKIDREIAKYPAGRQASAVIPLLWRAQEQHDYWLPKAAMELRPTQTADLRASLGRTRASATRDREGDV